MIKGILMDLDGTVYRGGQAIPGAAAFINRLHAERFKYLFVTNRSNRTPETVCGQLRSFNIPCEVDNVLTSAQATARYLQRGSVFYIGGEGLLEALKEAQMTIKEEGPDYVVVGYDPEIDYTKLEKASRLIRAGAQFIATNPDKVVHTESGLSPGNGAIVAAIAVASGVEPMFIGKPNRTIIDIALEQLTLSRDESILVGDNLETDIMAGINAGVRTALILTGVSSREDVTSATAGPTWIVKDYNELDRLVFEA